MESMQIQNVLNMFSPEWHFAGALHYNMTFLSLNGILKHGDLKR